MPAPSEPFVQERQIVSIEAGLEPAQNLFNSLLLLNKEKWLSGLDSWVERTLEQLPEERLERNRQVLEGLYGAILPRERYASFAAYVDALEAEDPGEWIERLLAYYADVPIRAGFEAKEPLPEELLENFEAYLDYLQARFDQEHIDEAVERQAHRWIQDPEEMQAAVIDHLRSMWELVLRQEWERVLPVLEASARAAQELDLRRREPQEAVRLVTGQPPDERLETALEQATEVIFVPSAHMGPYVGRIQGNGRLWILFGARIPEGTTVRSRDLDRTEMLNRLRALSDDTRLHILDLLAEHGELCAQDFITLLDLSQSSASRHLRQLAAIGFVRERRKDGAKCYQMNEERVRHSLKSLREFFRLD